MIDKLVLGTVQLGLKYGINNKFGKPSRKYSLQLLDKAYEIGIRNFDTASAYGDAEEILGEWISKNGIKNSVKIISKLKPNALESEHDVGRIIRNNVNDSIKRLKIDFLNGYLLHTPEYVYRNDVLKELYECKISGLISHLGVSIYEENDAIYAANNRYIDYIQIPYSFLDQRIDKTDFFNIAKTNKKTVFARSPFVQGLIFMDYNSIPENLIKAKEYLKYFDDIIAKYNVTRQEASLLFSLQQSKNDFTVFGVDTIEQLVEVCEIAVSNRKIDNCITELKKEFGMTDRSIVIPNLWKK